ncbi:MAG: hypothetical protein N2115_08405 [bacterium]|nr:hypothetical protein [bacterium]
MKKSGLGKDPLSWISSTLPEKRRSKVDQKLGRQIPKFQTFEIRLTVPFSQHHLVFLDQMQREILKNRSREYKKERITKNSIIRACVEAFKDVHINLKNIPDEKTLLQRLKEKIKL